MSERVLVVAGEASGDRIAALVAAALAERGIGCEGIAGPTARASGVRALADGAPLAAMGLADVAAALPKIAASVAGLLWRARRDPPRAALLVNFTELNQRLGRLLRARGTRVLWCVAPQVWAWRPRRIESLRGAFDRLAVILPFEEPLWRAAGHDATYVGHPSLEAPALALAPDRARSRARLGIAPDARAVAVLAGSRAGEVHRLADPLCEAARRLLGAGDADTARVIIAPGLDPRARALLEQRARAAGIAALDADPDHGAAGCLDAFDVALAASGTASLEAALVGAAPVVAYRLDPLTFAVARRLVHTPHIALPNVILGRRAFPELLQDHARAAPIAAAARDLLRDPDRSALASAELRAALAPPSPLPFGCRVADLLLPWLG